MTITVPVNKANRFAHIDAMRAFAVLLVVVAHAGWGSVVPGGSGVTIFFSVSGFIITYLLLRERDKTGSFSASQFYLRRAIKLAPPFLLVIIIPTLISSMWTYVNPAHFLGQVFFVFNWVHLYTDARVLTGTGVVWSLAIEEQFYIVFALIWLFAVKSTNWRRIMIILAGMAVIGSTLLRLILALDPTMTNRIYYGSDTRLDAIAWGVLAALVFHHWQELGSPESAFKRIMSRDWSLVAAIALYVMSLFIREDWFRDTLRYSLQSVSACTVILYGLIPGNGPLRKIFYSVSKLRLISLIGLASYSIYLVHLVIINTARDWMKLPPHLETVLVSLIGIAVGLVIYHMVERPAQHLGQKLRSERPTSLHQPAN